MSILKTFINHVDTQADEMQEAARPSKGKGRAFSSRPRIKFITSPANVVDATVAANALASFTTLTILRSVENVDRPAKKAKVEVVQKLTSLQLALQQKEEREKFAQEMVRGRKLKRRRGTPSDKIYFPNNPHNT
uniref:Uncharacterized protein n=1 Tax=Cannabis sativa TaxID=3483 RepID=A0A803P970_CANSA